MDRGTAHVYKGNYSTWLTQRQNRMNLEKKSDAARAKAMQAELEWIRQGAKVRNLCRLCSAPHQLTHRPSPSHSLPGPTIQG